jgi:hypothetical protein
MNLLFSLPQNIIGKLELLKLDYVSLVPNLNILPLFFINLLIALIMIFVCFSFGKKVLILIKFDFTKKYSYLISIAIGYILISSGVAILGAFSILKPIYLSIYLILIFIFNPEIIRWVKF